MNNCDCDFGYYDSGVAKCDECSYKCKQCENWSTNCLECAEDRHDYPTCDCVDGMYENGKVCVDCPYDCKTCNVDEELTCNDCTVDHRQLEDGRCLCYDGYYDEGTAEDSCS